jgi:hypothetical protein
MRSYLGEFPELVSGVGMRHMLVPAAQLRRWSEATACAVLREAMANSEAESRSLVELARSRGCGSSALDDVALFLAAEIASGALTAVALPEPLCGRPVLYSSDAPDWDNLKPISELIDTDPSTELTWVSIEVLDRRGVPFAGLDVTIVHGDGRRDRVVLDDLGRHTSRAVVAGSQSTVYWPPLLQLPEQRGTIRGIDGFARGPEDLAVPRRPEGRAVVLPQVGRHYRADRGLEGGKGGSGARRCGARGGRGWRDAAETVPGPTKPPARRWANRRARASSRPRACR